MDGSKRWLAFQPIPLTHGRSEVLPAPAEGCREANWRGKSCFFSFLPLLLSLRSLPPSFSSLFRLLASRLSFFTLLVVLLTFLSLSCFLSSILSFLFLFSVSAFHVLCHNSRGAQGGWPASSIGLDARVADGAGVACLGRHN